MHNGKWIDGLTLDNQWMHNGKWIDGLTLDNQWMDGWMGG